MCLRDRLLGEDLLNTLGRYDFPNEAEFVRSWVENLLYLQRKRIIHRDLSPENMIVHQESQGNFCPLIDFAMALQCPVVEGNVLPITPQNHCGKWPYMSPEVYHFNSLDFGVDVWALGCMLYYFWTRERLYYHPADFRFSFLFFQGALTIADEGELNQLTNDPDLLLLWDSLQGLSVAQLNWLRKMLAINPLERISSAEILQQPYFQQGDEHMM